MSFTVVNDVKGKIIGIRGGESEQGLLFLGCFCKEVAGFAASPHLGWSTG